MMTLRFIKFCMVASIALFFSIISFNNIVDYTPNWLFVHHVLSMDTTFKNPSIMSRAITNPDIQRYFYYLIIAWEIITAIICWTGCFVLLAKIKTKDFQFNESKQIAFIGLFFGFLLYMGFIVIGGEWFSMWQSVQWNGQKPASIFLSLILFVMLFLQQNDQ